MTQTCTRGPKPDRHARSRPLPRRRPTSAAGALRRESGVPRRHRSAFLESSGRGTGCRAANQQLQCKMTTLRAEQHVAEQRAPLGPASTRHDSSHAARQSVNTARHAGATLRTAGIDRPCRREVAAPRKRTRVIPDPNPKLECPAHRAAFRRARCWIVVPVRSELRGRGDAQTG